MTSTTPATTPTTNQTPGPIVTAMLGDWCGEKTRAAADRFVRALLANPRTPTYFVRAMLANTRTPTHRPRAVVLAPTDSILRRATIPALEAAIPADLIVERLDLRWVLENGCEVVFAYGLPSFEGEVFCAAFIDAIEMYWRTEFLGCLARVSDPLSPHLEMVVSGLATARMRAEFGDTQ